ncbi:nuclear transport factor 2 family protein [Muricauda sp. CAU 1633]|uniref:nuclear transport factor 2 family protein n=1 Tax=Allomuricauda sp. CAU 1633 TaxID=2816036 RepID=UPI001A8EFA3D|nr:nuclear transport factor 2 family protein [Muricauda sp. CAU 1633]MBO0320845.1 nuclear transport factor 2 family protein [Muricauda sp. CAU 1633]
MNRYFISIAILALLSCKTETQTSKSTSIISEQDRAALRHLKEVDWPKAYREQDTILLDSILGDDFQMIDADGNWSNKAQELDWIKAHASPHDSFFFEIKRLDILPNGTAMICGTGHIFKDSTKTIYQSSNVVVKRDGQWKAIASHVSGIQQVD